MKINANLLDLKIEAASIQDWARLDSPLKRLSQHLISGEEVVELLQQYRLLSQLQRELIIDTELESIECTAEEIFSAYKAFYHHQQINSDEDRATWLERNHFTLSQLERLILRTVKLARFKRETFGSKVDSYFLQRKSQLDRASYSLLRVKDFHLAQELFFRLEAGEATFPELVKQYSQGQEAETGGSIGPHELSVPHPILVQKIRSLKLGQLAPPLQIAEWFVVIRLDKFFSAQLDEKMRERLIEEIYDRWIQNQLNQLSR
ncbi:peptidylprolyl isomerase [Chamaesiphon sp. VAR_48_metabat_135_sub]|uniref:peptidylprolyl isomerase n=1 Tax=Chamaesiphon sp. VAR_48_metabat_135_sub TaxID=2964699 RepID=UPI00286BD8C4|nr:peptidylprolyl isomerase [Chamaesiphon sp. VAR_48_metabat_135_sub]